MPLIFNARTQVLWLPEVDTTSMKYQDLKSKKFNFYLQVLN